MIKLKYKIWKVLFAILFISSAMFSQKLSENITTNCPEIKAVIIEPKSINCSNELIKLDGSMSSSGSNFTYKWTANGGKIESGADSNIAYVSDYGYYKLVVTDNVTGCSSVDDIFVPEKFFTPKVKIKKIGSISNVNSILYLDASSSLWDSPYGSFKWTTSNGQITEGFDKPIVTVTSVGDYTLTLTNPSTGCSTIQTVKVENEILDPIVNIPDLNFKSELIYSPLNTNNDGEIQISEALEVKSLSLSFVNLFHDMRDWYYCVKSVEGLQYFENLTELRAVASEMYPCSTSTPVDLSGLKYLTKFECAEGGCSYVNLENNLSLKYVDVHHSANNFKGCYNLETLRARYSNLDLDFTNYTKLKSINSYVSINSLKIKGCSSLETVDLEADSNISGLDFSDCINLKSLSIYESGKLTELNLNNVNKLEKLVVSASNLDYLDLSNMPNLKTTYIAYGINNLNIKNVSLFTVEPNSENGYKEGLNLEYASDLKSICVDEGEYEFVKSLVEKYGHNSTITTDCTNLSVSENEFNALNTTFSPNPTQGKITFTEKVDEVKVFDLSGRLVKTNTVNTTEVDLSDLQKGVYMMQVSQNNKTFTAKVVKE